MKPTSKTYQGNCIDLFKNIEDNSIDLTLTDIPYSEVHHSDNGLRNIDKGKADVITFDLIEFLDNVYAKTKGSIIIFCGIEQVSTICHYFKQKDGTTRHLIWEKTNPMVMNGKHVYLSGIEDAIWFKKPGATFNANCKNTVFRHPSGSSEIHPTEKNHKLLKELILDNSNEGDLVFDPCMGSGSCGIVATQLGRNFIGFELDENYYEIATNRIKQVIGRKLF